MCGILNVIFVRIFCCCLCFVSSCVFVFGYACMYVYVERYAPVFSRTTN